MSVEAISFLCNNLTKKIKKLSLFGIRDCRDLRSYFLEEEHVIALANRCPQLEELDFGPWKGRENRNFEVALSTIIEKMPNLVKLSLPGVCQILSPMLLKLGSMPNLKHLHVYDKTNSKSPLIKALVKNLQSLKINEGSFDIAHPDPRNLGYLWEMQCEPTQDFINHEYS